MSVSTTVVSTRSFLPAVLQIERNRGLHHAVIDGFKRASSEPIESPVEGVVFGNALAVEMREQIASNHLHKLSMRVDEHRDRP